MESWTTPEFTKLNQMVDRVTCSTCEMKYIPWPMIAVLECSYATACHSACREKRDDIQSLGHTRYAHLYPLIPVITMPCTKYRCAKKKRTINGRTAMVVAAIRGSISMTVLPENRRRDSATVYLSAS